MKVEGNAHPVLLNDPERGSRVHNEKVTHVLLPSGWVQIIPGSFKLLQSQGKNGLSIPWVIFKQQITDDAGNVSVVQVELTSPASLHAVAYPDTDADGQ